ncbi:MAG: hypothetical protein CSA75_04350, partial [Sorangium cellulosum]
FAIFLLLQSPNHTEILTYSRRWRPATPIWRRATPLNLKFSLNNHNYLSCKSVTRTLPFSIRNARERETNRTRFHNHAMIAAKHY